MKVKGTKNGKKKKIHYKKNAIKNKNMQNGKKKSFRSTSKESGLSLREKMLSKLKSSRFRYINEKLYTMNGNDALKHFKEDNEAFLAYHEGYQKQVEQWPINPVDVVIELLEKLIKEETIIADFGCGEAKIAKTFPKNQIHSFDLVSLDPLVKVCDMANTSLPPQSVDIVVFCLSLMGTNFQDYITEANRVLKLGGTMLIAEVSSRFENVDHFLEKMMSYGFKSTSCNLNHDLFYYLNFIKERPLGKKSKKKLPELILKPCLYKKR